jgi:beta-N-acetylhexosaminidase
MVMTSTGSYRAFGSSPALFSKRVIDGELRTRLHFAGVSITDDLEVPALAGYGSPERRALLAARAGNDLLLFAQTYASGRDGFRALLRAARSGGLDLRADRAAATRVIELQRWLAKRAH